MVRSALILAFVIGGVAMLSAQAPAAALSPPAFEVASVKRNFAPPFLRFSILPGGQLVVQGHSLDSIIQHAFGIGGVRVTGMPGWAQSERYDITAKAATGMSGGSQQVMAMLQTLLRMRFNLRTRIESQEVPIYRLILASDDARLGSGLRASDSDCSGFVPGRSEAPEPDAGPGCTIFASSTAASSATTFRLRGRSMTKLASDLQVFTDRPVRDDTGRAGLFDVELSFVYPTARVPVQPGQDDVTLFTALQEQLGLKLEPARGPVEVLVIESVQRPTPD